MTPTPMCLTPVFAFVPQYSQKEDKYEEEIKVLTDKLKEVRFHEALSGARWSSVRVVDSLVNLFSPSHRLRLVLSSLRDQ